MKKIERITIVGAGAMGCLFAARLAKMGRTVTLIDTDPARLAALSAQGVTLHDDAGSHNAPVQACLAADAGETDLVMLFTKGMHSAAAIASVKHLAKPGVLALTLQNGLGNAERIAEHFDADAVLIGATDFPADLTGPTNVSSHGQGNIWLGAYAGAGQDALQSVAELFNEADLRAVVDPNVLVSIWEKVAFNAALNSLAAITGLRVGGMDMPAGRRIAAAVVSETVAVAHASGVMVDAAAISKKVDFALTHHRPHKASMLQDREAGRATEIESINGAVERAAQLVGLQTPVTSALADIIRLIETPGEVA